MLATSDDGSGRVELGAPLFGPDRKPPVEAEPSAVILLRPPGDTTTDWPLTCRYCGKVKDARQGLAAHERQCHQRPATPPAGNGPFDIAIFGGYNHWTWEARVNGELVADALGREWVSRDSASVNAESFLAGPWNASQSVTTSAKRKRAKAAAKRAPAKPTRPPAAKGTAVVAKPMPEPSELLAVLDGMAKGRAWPASAMLDVARWVESTLELLEKAQ